MSGEERRMKRKLALCVSVGSPSSRSRPEAAQTNCGSTEETSPCSPAPADPTPSPPPLSTSEAFGWRSPSLCSAGDVGPSSSPCSRQSSTRSPGEGLFRGVWGAPGDIYTGFQGFWHEKRVVSHPLACLGAWVGSLWRPEGFEAGGWRWESGWSQAELAALWLSLGPPRGCAGLLLGSLHRTHINRFFLSIIFYTVTSFLYLSDELSSLIVAAAQTTEFPYGSPLRFLLFLNYLALLLPSRSLQDRWAPTCPAPGRRNRPSGQSGEHSAEE